MSSTSISSSDLLWVTNIPTPYRAPLWSALGSQRQLTVAFLADSEPNRSWQVDLDHSRYSTVSLNARPLVKSGDSTIYAPSNRLIRLLNGRPRAIVMDGWESPAYLAARWWAKHRGVPVIASYRSTLATHRYATGPVPALRRWFFQGADAVLTAGQASTQAVVSMGICRSRVVEGFNTVDVDRFVLGAARTRAGRSQIPGHHFLYVGQFIVRKNVETLIRAFSDTRTSDDTLTLVGSGPLEGRLRAVVSELQLDASVIFLGSLNGDSLVEAYALAHTLVLPSTEEVWGLVVNEALAAGLHAVVSSTCGITPSIAHMPGVITTEPDGRSIMSALRKSKRSWAGHITGHPITFHTPEALSKIVLRMVDEVYVSAE
jgi:glycosyltransferase involved in cell wall biosynthesis